MSRLLSLSRLSAILTLTATSLLCSLNIAQDQPKKDVPQVLKDVPQPIQILRKGGKVTIPEVKRDQVIGFAMYTVSDNTLKMAVQLYPLQENEKKEVTLQIKKNGSWEDVQSSPVDTTGWLANFRVEKWNHSKDFSYRVTHSAGAKYEGLIRKDPIDKDEIVVAAFTGNSNTDRSLREDIVANVKAQDPDLLFFSGDQSYDHRSHTAAWLLFGRQFGDIIKDRPTVSIPDDHDVGQGNLWGEGGKVSKARGGDDGGYIMPADYVNMVQRAQTSNLPDPYDPTPIKQNIGVYYTSLNIGGIDFAIIEDRKWKTGPRNLVPQQGPRPDHITNPKLDPYTVDVPEAVLLGERQLKFLDEWGQNWDGAVMKSVLSQTIFAGGAHIHGRHNGRLVADLDSNGWPQTGRNKALIAMRKSYAFHIAGDQHLATVIHHGVNEFEDSGYSFCVPSIVNYYGRWWYPEEEPVNHDPKSPLPYTGQFYDGFKNKVTMQAYANPTTENFNAAGYGIVRFKKSTRDITMECWKRHIDVTSPDAQQHPGWPIKINQFDNYGRKPLTNLPTLEIKGQSDSVVQVIDEYLDTVAYTVRIKGNSFTPGVFKHGTYTIKVGEGDNVKVFKNVATLKKDETKTITVELK